MKEVFLYDENDGNVFHCLFTGMDFSGHAQWLNLTRDALPESLYNGYVGMEDLRVLSADDKPVLSKYIAKVLSLKMNSYSKDINDRMVYAIKHMKEIGLDWTNDGVVLDFHICCSKNGNYSLYVSNPGHRYDLFNRIEDFGSLERIFDNIQKYLFNLESTAKIPVHLKFIQIDNKLKGKIKDAQLVGFDNVTYVNE